MDPIMAQSPYAWPYTGTFESQTAVATYESQICDNG